MWGFTQDKVVSMFGKGVLASIYSLRPLLMPRSLSLSFIISFLIQLIRPKLSICASSHHESLRASVSDVEEKRGLFESNNDPSPEVWKAWSSHPGELELPCICGQLRPVFPGIMNWHSITLLEYEIRDIPPSLSSVTRLSRHCSISMARFTDWICVLKCSRIITQRS